MRRKPYLTIGTTFPLTMATELIIWNDNKIEKKNTDEVIFYHLQALYPSSWVCFVEDTPPTVASARIVRLHTPNAEFLFDEVVSTNVSIARTVLDKKKMFSIENEMFSVSLCKNKVSVYMSSCGGDLLGDRGVLGVPGRDSPQVLVLLSRLFSRVSNTSSDMDSSTADRPEPWCWWSGLNTFSSMSPITWKLGSTMNSMKPERQSR